MLLSLLSSLLSSLVVVTLAVHHQLGSAGSAADPWVVSE